ncbi:hypothetical protein SDC9_78151 [bioreactor metagenome]|uniref:Uncharacterized protein n=1 Tax=bioreactor metagenome TaxID=1076179 RepID=A0A644YSN6_9ZZZZ
MNASICYDLLVKKIPRAIKALGKMLVTRRGFEPRTHCLKGSWSVIKVLSAVAVDKNQRTVYDKN